MTHTSHSFELVWTIPNSRERDRLAKKMQVLDRLNSEESSNIFQLSNKDGSLNISLSPKEKSNIIETYALALCLMEIYRNTKVTPILYSRNNELGLQEVAVVENELIHVVSTPCI